MPFSLRSLNIDFLAEERNGLGCGPHGAGEKAEVHERGEIAVAFG
jgi:hypothetical protein